MSEYLPEFRDMIIFSDDEIFVVWRAHWFEMYKRLTMGNELVDSFVDFNIEDENEAEERVAEWVQLHVKE